MRHRDSRLNIREHVSVCAREALRSALTNQVLEIIGGAEEDRTPDLCSAIAALSHLSYGPEVGAI
jgi:hypothetical protein